MLCKLNECSIKRKSTWPEQGILLTMSLNPCDLNQPPSPHTTHQPHWPAFCYSNLPCLAPPRGLCTYCSLCWNASLPWLTPSVSRTHIWVTLPQRITWLSSSHPSKLLTSNFFPLDLSTFWHFTTYLLIFCLKGKEGINSVFITDFRIHEVKLGLTSREMNRPRKTWTDKEV